MPVNCDFRPNGVIVWHSGEVTGKEMVTANEEIYAHSYEEGLHFQLLDLTDVTEFNAVTGDMNKLAEMDRNAEKRVKQYACVVAPTAYMFELARLWDLQSYEGFFETNVVRSQEEALSWFAERGIEFEI